MPRLSLEMSGRSLGSRLGLSTPVGSNFGQTTVALIFIHSFIHSRIYKAPLQEIDSEAPPAQPRRYRSVLSNLQNALSLFLGRIRISKGSPFQVEGPTMENARRCPM